MAHDGLGKTPPPAGGALGRQPREGRWWQAGEERLAFDRYSIYHGTVLGLVVDQIVTSVLERPEQRHGREDAMPFPRLSDVHVTQEILATIGCEQRISADSHMTKPPDLWERRPP